MSDVFHWTPSQHKWVLDSIDILWALSRGAKPTGNKKTIHDYIGRKAKIMGLLPFGLFPGVRLEEKWSHPGTSVYTKEVFNSKDFDFRKIVIEVISSGSADASLMALKKINTFQGLVSKAEDNSRHERMQLWQTYLTKSDDCLSDAFMSIWRMVEANATSPVEYVIRCFPTIFCIDFDRGLRKKNSSLTYVKYSRITSCCKLMSRYIRRVWFVVSTVPFPAH